MVEEQLCWRCIVSFFFGRSSSPINSANSTFSGAPKTEVSSNFFLALWNTSFYEEVVNNLKNIPFKVPMLAWTTSWVTAQKNSKNVVYNKHKIRNFYKYFTIKTLNKLFKTTLTKSKTNLDAFSPKFEWKVKRLFQYFCTNICLMFIRIPHKIS